MPAKISELCFRYELKKVVVIRRESRRIKFFLFVSDDSWRIQFFLFVRDDSRRIQFCLFVWERFLMNTFFYGSIYYHCTVKITFFLIFTAVAWRYLTAWFHWPEDSHVCALGARPGGCFHSSKIHSSKTLSQGSGKPNCVLVFSVNRVWLVTLFYVFLNIFM